MGSIIISDFMEKEIGSNNKTIYSMCAITSIEMHTTQPYVLMHNVVRMKYK